MTKAKQAQFQSLKLAGYALAKTSETNADIAAYVLEQCPTLLDEVPAEVKADLFEGFALRAHELWGQDYYVKGDTGMLLKVANSLDPNFAKREVKKGEIVVSVHYARSFTGQEFGKLKDSDPALHGIVSAWRIKFTKYSGNRMSDLFTAAKRLVQGDQPKARSANKAFAEWIKETFETADKRAKVAMDRGDESASQVKFRVARDAFWKAYNAK